MSMQQIYFDYEHIALTPFVKTNYKQVLYDSTQMVKSRLLASRSGRGHSQMTSSWCSRLGYTDGNQFPYRMD